MHQIYHVEPAPLQLLRDGVPPRLEPLIARALSKRREDRHADWESFAQELSALVANGEVPRGPLQGVLDSERFNLLRSLEFFAGFGDVELWEVVHRAQWQRCAFGHALYRHGEEGNSFHIIAQGQVDVYRDGQRVAQLGAGTSVGEMAYLAPSPDAAHPQRRRGRVRAGDHHLVHAADAGAAGPGHAPPVRRRLHPRAGAPAACRARGAGASATHPLSRGRCRVRPRCRVVVQSRAAANTPHSHDTHDGATMKTLMSILTLAARGLLHLGLCGQRRLRGHGQGKEAGRRRADQLHEEVRSRCRRRRQLRSPGHREEAGRRGQDQLRHQVREGRRRRRQQGRRQACDAQAAEKKLAGAAKTSFTKKCIADAGG